MRPAAPAVRAGTKSTFVYKRNAANSLAVPPSQGVRDAYVTLGWAQQQPGMRPPPSLNYLLRDEQPEATLASHRGAVAVLRAAGHTEMLARAKLALHRGDWPEATCGFRCAVELWPELWSAYAGLGRALTGLLLAGTSQVGRAGHKRSLSQTTGGQASASAADGSAPAPTLAGEAQLALRLAQLHGTDEAPVQLALGQLLGAEVLRRAAHSLLQGRPMPVDRTWDEAMQLLRHASAGVGAPKAERFVDGGELFWAQRAAAQALHELAEDRATMAFLASQRHENAGFEQRFLTKCFGQYYRKYGGKAVGSVVGELN